MFTFQTNRPQMDIGDIEIRGFRYSTDDPVKAAFLRKNLSSNLWEIKTDEQGMIIGATHVGEEEKRPILTEEVAGETVIKNVDPVKAPALFKKRPRKADKLEEGKQ